MSAKRVVVTAGPIPARLDSVKFVSNRFRGRLMAKVATELGDRGLDVTLMRWRHQGPEFPNVILCDDVRDYRDKLLDLDADAFVLGAAVANLMPSDPWPTKFPSHEYEVGEKFNIGFEISPRVIDELKDRHPRCCLIGYKLFDGTDEDLISAARKTLVNSRANAIFANTPDTAKSHKRMVTQDYADIPMSFDEHINWIERLIISEFYRTQVYQIPFALSSDVIALMKRYPRTTIHDRTFGTFAVRDPRGGFFTTSRGKRDDSIVRVANVNHADRLIFASGKATLNAPLLDRVFRAHPEAQVILHDHWQLFGTAINTHEYEFPGTDREARLGDGSGKFFNIRNHGYVAWFKSAEEALEWMPRQ